MFDVSNIITEDFPCLEKDAKDIMKLLDIG